MFKKIPAYLLFTRIGRIILLILLVCIAVIYFFIGSNLFLVRKVEILNSKLIDERSLLRWKGKNIFLLPVNALIKKIDEIPEVKSVIVRKELPNRVTVEVQEYTPSAFLSQPSSFFSKFTGENPRLAVSQEGVVFPFKEKVVYVSAYPSVVYEKGNENEDLPVGQVWPGLEEAMDAYLSLKDTVLIDVIKVKKDKAIFLYIENAKTEIRMSRENYKKEVDYLKILMKELPSKNVEYIDLRFGEDIVVKP